MASSMVRAFGLMEGSAEESVAPGRALIARAQQGEEAAFECLYRQHGARVYSLCFWLTGDEMQARDLTQEAFLRAFRKIRVYRGDVDFATRLGGITLTLILERLRESASSGEGCLDGIVQPNQAGGWRNEIESLRCSRCTLMEWIRLRPAIRELPAGHRILFVLHDVFGYPHDQIAVWLGCSPGNSKSLLHKARIRLRALLCGTHRAAPRSEETLLRQEEEAG